ncbi:uncharacterized protein PSFLO_03969 [Pseudozyma flocculosa]|uniref:Uncharacterized protein n=1 Tax=Pseudozyma flocculosa TaxID=84751 RepID=A0A5C3F5H0_9BASI|nr:uncharacterized protein PSFLO_03969 [Pseudozyma flocculosa]
MSLSSHPTPAHSEGACIGDSPRARAPGAALERWQRQPADGSTEVKRVLGMPGLCGVHLRALSSHASVIAAFAQSPYQAQRAATSLGEQAVGQASPQRAGRPDPEAAFQRRGSGSPGPTRTTILHYARTHTHTHTTTGTGSKQMAWRHLEASSARRSGSCLSRHARGLPGQSRRLPGLPRSCRPPRPHDAAKLQLARPWPGKQARQPASKQGSTAATSEVLAGATAICLATLPTGWPASTGVAAAGCLLLSMPPVAAVAAVAAGPSLLLSWQAWSSAASAWYLTHGTGRVVRHQRSSLPPDRHLRTELLALNAAGPPRRLLACPGQLDVLHAGTCGRGRRATSYELATAHPGATFHPCATMPTSWPQPATSQLFLAVWRLYFDVPLDPHPSSEREAQSTSREGSPLAGATSEAMGYETNTCLADRSGPSSSAVVAGRAFAHVISARPVGCWAKPDGSAGVHRSSNSGAARHGGWDGPSGSHLSLCGSHAWQEGSDLLLLPARSSSRPGPSAHPAATHPIVGRGQSTRRPGLASYRARLHRAIFDERRRGPSSKGRSVVADPVCSPRRAIVGRRRRRRRGGATAAEGALLARSRPPHARTHARTHRQRGVTSMMSSSSGAAACRTALLGTCLVLATLVDAAARSWSLTPDLACDVDPVKVRPARRVETGARRAGGARQTGKRRLAGWLAVTERVDGSSASGWLGERGCAAAAAAAAAAAPGLACLSTQREGVSREGDQVEARRERATHS